MALEKAKRTNLVREIGVLRGTGYEAGIQAMESVKRSADIISDNAFKYGADKLSKEGLYDAKDKQLDYTTDYYVESQDGIKKITDVLDEKDNVIGSFKTPIIDERLPAGPIYNEAYNRERDKIYGLNIKANALVYADELYVKFQNDSEGFVTAVDAYLEQVKENVGPSYQNDIELLEADVFSSYYKQIAMRELNQEMSRNATKLIMGFNTLTTNAITEIKQILPSVDSQTFSLEWNAETNEVKLKGVGEKEGLTDIHSMYVPIKSKLDNINKEIQTILNSELLGDQTRVNIINNFKRSIASTLVQNMVTNANADDLEPQEGQLSLRQLELSISGETENMVINDLKKFVGYDDATVKGWSEMVNNQRLIINGINGINKDDVKMFMESELMDDLNMLSTFLIDGKHDPMYAAKRDEIIKKWQSIDSLFQNWDLPSSIKSSLMKYSETRDGKHLFAAITGSFNNQTIMNNGTFLRLMKEQSAIWTSGVVIDFLMIGEDAEKLMNWSTELFSSEEFKSQDVRYREKIIAKVVARLKSINTEAGTKLEKMWKVKAALAVNHQEGIGYTKLDANSATDRQQAEDFILYSDVDKQRYTHPVYGVDKSSLKIRGDDENMMLKYIANLNVIPTTEYDWLNGIKSNTLDSDIAIQEAFNKFHFFKKIQNLTDYSGGNTGEKIVASLDVESLAMFHMIDRQLQNYSPDNMPELMSAIRKRIDFDHNMNKDNAFTDVEKYGDDTKQQKLFKGSEVWNNMVTSIKGYDVTKIWESEAKYEIMQVYKTNRFKGYDAQSSMDSAISHVLFFRWHPSKFGFSAMSASSGLWEKGDRQMAHLPVEMFFSGHDTDLDGKPDFQWLETFILDGFVAKADWSFVDGIKMEDVPEKTEWVTAHGDTWKKVTPAHKLFQILKYPDNPKAGYLDLVLGENLFLKATPNVYNKGYPMYELYFRQPDVGQVYWGQLKKLTNEDGEPFTIDIGVQFEKINKERFHKNLMDAKELRLDWLEKEKDIYSYTKSGEPYLKLM